MKREPARAFAGASLTRLACALCFLAGAALLVFPIGSRSQPTAETAVAAGGLSPVSLQGSSRPDALASTAGTPRAGYRNIEDIRVGQRVHAHNPEIGVDERAAWEEPDWSEWRQLQLEMSQPGGGTLQITMLRPVEWLELAEAAPGSEIELDLAEMGACGMARVVAVGAGPPVPSGPGQVVTATFSHPPATQVLDVTIGQDPSSDLAPSEPETIGVTDNHLFWSFDHEEFLPIGEMALGERLLTYHGDTKRILGKLPRPGPQVVYNLEVYGEHVYFVGELGLLAHNRYTGDAENLGRGLELRTYEIKGSRTGNTYFRRLKYNTNTKEVDFSRYYLKDKSGTPIIESIKYTGSRNADFNAANLQRGVSQPDGYTWHHLDYDPRTGKGRMVLVKSDVHEAAGHSGGVSHYVEATGNKYRD